MNLVQHRIIRESLNTNLLPERCIC